ncbi:hypothetical protein POTOM_057389 [Populus tomentosa]|uniref:Small nuclear ribonucleoprotein E n=1 Tax=Populus tomentosa TaxID=118781 RepID=A0A8X8C1Q2_POPTO|nr:hypothetical protein POTOM_057389 [Populus tomentosa]
MASTKVQRIMTQPINLIFRFLQSKARIQIWLFEQKDLRIEGRIIENVYMLVCLCIPLGIFIVRLLLAPHEAVLVVNCLEKSVSAYVLGFDEYMNLVLEDAEEVNIKKKSRKSLGRILLKGDNITLMMNTGK